MKQRSEKWERLLALFVFGSIFLNFPLLATLDTGQTIFDIPLLYIYLFGIWAVLIALSAWIIERWR